MDLDAYHTVSGDACGEVEDRKSRFIGYVFPVSDAQTAMERIQAIKTKHWDARHWVYAFRLREGNLCRYSDDGEPAGSAGPPVREVLAGMGLLDCGLVVVRYFGGTLLGVGGLVRAYTAAAHAALHNAQIVTMRHGLCYELTCGYAAYAQVQYCIVRHGGVIGRTEYGEAIRVFFCLPAKCREAFEQAAAATIGGGETYRVTGERFFSSALANDGQGEK